MYGTRNSHFFCGQSNSNIDKVSWNHLHPTTGNVNFPQWGPNLELSHIQSKPVLCLLPSGSHVGAMTDFVSIPVNKIPCSVVLGKPNLEWSTMSLPPLAFPAKQCLGDWWIAPAGTISVLPPPSPHLPISQVLSLIWIHGDTEGKALNTHDSICFVTAITQRQRLNVYSRRWTQQRLENSCL